MKWTAALPLLAALASSSPVLLDSINNEAAPVISSLNGETVPDKYIVVFKKHVKHADALEHHDWVQNVHTQQQVAKLELKKRNLGSSFEEEVFGGLKHTFNIAGSLLGYSGHFDEETIEAVRRHPDVSETPSLRFRTCPNIVSRVYCSESCHRHPSAACPMLHSVSPDNPAKTRVTRTNAVPTTG